MDLGLITQETGQWCYARVCVLRIYRPSSFAHKMIKHILPKSRSPPFSSLAGLRPTGTKGGKGVVEYIVARKAHLHGAPRRHGNKIPADSKPARAAILLQSKQNLGTKEAINAEN